MTKGLFDYIFYFSARSRKERELEKERERKNTNQKKLEDLVREETKNDLPEIRNLMVRMTSHGWDIGEILSSRSSLGKLRKELGTIPKSVYTLLDHAIIFDSLALLPTALQEADSNDIPVITYDTQFRNVIDAIHLMESAKRPARWIYLDLWDKWHGKNSGENSLQFSTDISLSAPVLKDAGEMPKRARTLFLKMMDDFKPTPQNSYGRRTARLAQQFIFANENTHPHTYSYCEHIYREAPQTRPELYGELFSLSSDMPKKVDTLLARTISYLPARNDKNQYLRKLETIVRRVNKLLMHGTYKPALVGDLFTNSDFKQEEADKALTSLAECLEAIDERSDERIFRAFNEIMPHLQAAHYNIDAVLFSFAKRFKDPKEQERFSRRIEVLRKRHSPIELYLYAQSYNRKRNNEKLYPQEEEYFAKYTTEAELIQTERVQDKKRIHSLIGSNGKAPSLCPDEVIEFYRAHFNREPLPHQLNLGDDQGAWLCHPEAVAAYLKAKNVDYGGKEGVNTNLLGNTLKNLAGNNLLEDKIALIALACGSAVSELYFCTELEEQYKKDIDLYLVDINDAMLERAAVTCEMRDPKLLKKDIRKLNYKDITDYVEDKLLLITLFGRTICNVEKGLDLITQALFNIANEHYYSKHGHSIVLIEGDHKKNMAYYKDPGSERMMFNYAKNRLEVNGDIFLIDGKSTYAAILTPDKSKVQFYMLVTKDLAPTDGDPVIRKWLRKDCAIRLGESRTLTDEDKAYFERSGFNYYEIPDSSDSVMAVLTPKYETFQEPITEIIPSPVTKLVKK